MNVASVTEPRLPPTHRLDEFSSRLQTGLNRLFVQARSRSREHSFQSHFCDWGVKRQLSRTSFVNRTSVINRMKFRWTPTAVKASGAGEAAFRKRDATKSIGG